MSEVAPMVAALEELAAWMRKNEVRRLKFDEIELEIATKGTDMTAPITVHIDGKNVATVPANAT